MYNKASVPIITQPKTPNYEVPQSKYEQVPRLPIRALLLGASGSWKGVLLSNRITDVYDNVFVGQTYVYGRELLILTLPAVKKHPGDKLKMSNTGQLHLYYDSYNPEELETVIEAQSKVVDYQKKNKQNNYFKT